MQGKISNMEQLLAFCDWEREHNPHPKGNKHVAQWAAEEIARLRTVASAALQAWDAQVGEGGGSVELMAAMENLRLVVGGRGGR